MLAGPDPNTLPQAQNNLDAAKQKLAALQTPPDANTLTGAQASLDAAQQKLTALQAHRRP